MSDDTKAFDLGDILSITTGMLVSPRRMTGVYEILNWMTDDNLFTHQLPRATVAMRPILLAQHPQLAVIEVPTLDATTAVDWLTAQKQRFGETLPVEIPPRGSWRYQGAMEELEAMVGKDRILPISTDETDPGARVLEKFVSERGA